MALGIFVLRRSYTFLEYTAGFMLCAGIATFTLVDSKVSAFLHSSFATFSVTVGTCRETFMSSGEPTPIACTGFSSIQPGRGAAAARGSVWRCDDSQPPGEAAAPGGIASPLPLIRAICDSTSEVSQLHANHSG
eukprot:2631603-Rhodomonas_salina.2